jgi:VanZ family protein
MAASMRAPRELASFQVWPALAYALALLVMGSLPVAPPGAAEVSDKTVHSVAFGLLAMLSARAFLHLDPRASRSAALARGFAAAVIVGGALELWQALLPYRSCELLDWAADALGAALAVVLLGIAWSVFRRGRAPQ